MHFLSKLEQRGGHARKGAGTQDASRKSIAVIKSATPVSKIGQRF
jgi:hypothetical protein